MIKLFTDEISMSLLNWGCDLITVRKLIKELKLTLVKESVIKSQSDLEEFKKFEKINILKSLGAVQYDDSEFKRLKFEINPYLIFTESNISERGLLEGVKHNIILHPNFIACNTFHFVPIYLRNKDKNLNNLKLKFNSFYCEELQNTTNATKEEIVDILKSFLLKQYIIISENG